MSSTDEGFGIEDARAMLEWAGYRVTEPKLNGRDLRRDEARMNQLRAMVDAGNSLSEIERVMKMDWRTIKRHFPYAGWGPGGSGDAAEVRETNRQLREFLRRGKIGSNRDAGFNLRGGR